MSDCSVLEQHCTEPVSHCAKPAVAAARMAKMVSLENMLIRVAELCLKACSDEDLDEIA